MIKVVSALLLLLGSGLIFRALVAMDAPALRLRPLRREPIDPSTARRLREPGSLRRAA
jgi:hypothetical protein